MAWTKSEMAAIAERCNLVFLDVANLYEYCLAMRWTELVFVYPETFGYARKPIEDIELYMRRKDAEEELELIRRKRGEKMNKVILIGRLTKDTETRVTQGENATTVARYTLAVDRRFKRDGDQAADFINCVAFGRQADFAEKYLHKGMKICVTGRIQTGSYTNKDGQKVYTTDVIVEDQEFCESKNASTPNTQEPAQESSVGNGFMNIPDNLDEELPWN